MIVRKEFSLLCGILLLSGSSVFSVELNYEPVVSNPSLSGPVSFGDLDSDGIEELWRTWHFFASRGGSQTGVTLYKGTSSGQFQLWKQWNFSPPPSATVAYGDFFKDGKLDLLIAMPHEMGIYTWEGTDFVIRPVTSDYPSLSYITLSQSGDFDGDGFRDFVCGSTSETLLCFFGDGQGYFKHRPIQMVIQEVRLALDMNRDGAEDLVSFSEQSMVVYYGSATREEAFSATSSIDLEFSPQAIIPLDYDRNAISDLYVASATQTQVILNDGAKGLTPVALTFPASWNPTKAVFADLNLDSEVEFISWNRETIRIYQTVGTTLMLLREITIPYVSQIDTIHVSDMDLDGVPDLLLFTHEGPSITLFNRPVQPTPTPTLVETQPTPTPTIPPATPTPTPTPIMSIPGAISVAPEASKPDIVNNAPSGSVLLFEPGIYGQMGFGYNILIENKELHLIGKNPDRSTRLWGNFTIKNSNVTLQNISFRPSPSFFTGFRAENSDLTLINNHFIAPISYQGESWYFSGGPNLVYVNSESRTLTLVDNTIEQGNTGESLLIENSKNSRLDMARNPRFGIGNGPATLYIKNSEAMEIVLGFLRPDYDSSLTYLNVSHSTLDIIGGAILGLDGSDGIAGQNGGNALEASHQSSVVLHDTIVFGGRGGNGIQPGLDGQALVVDDTSQVNWITAVFHWDLME